MLEVNDGVHSNYFIDRWFSFAKRHIFRCDHRTHNVVAVILINKRLISVGWNDTNKSHPEMSQLNCHKKLHAELMAINKVKHKHDLSKAQMVVYAETKAGLKVLGKPCPYCHELIKRYGIKDVIYSSHEGHGRIKVA